MATVEYGESDKLGAVAVSSPGQDASYRVELEGLEAGATYYYRVRSVDPAGNEAVSDILSFAALADEHPNVTILSPASAALLKGDVELKVRVQDDWGIASVRYAIDDGPFEALGRGVDPGVFTATIDTFAMDDGVHDITVRAIDTANQSTEVTEQVAFDNTGPVIGSVVATDDDRFRVSIRWRTNEPATSAVDFGMDSDLGIRANIQDLSTLHVVSLTGLLPGTVYYFRVRSIDAAGNKSLSVMDAFITEPDSPPTVSIIDPFDGDLVSGLFVLRAVAEDDWAVSAVEFSVDSGPFVAMSYNAMTDEYEGVIDPNAIGSGPHRLRVRARDDIAQPALAQVVVTVDTAPGIAGG